MTNRSLVVRCRETVTSKIFAACAVVVALFLIGGAIAPGFLHLSHMMTILGLSAFLGIIALGQTLAVLAGGEGLDLSVGAVVSLSAVIAATVLQGNDANLLIALGAVVLTGLAIGVVNGLGISFFRIPPLVMTLAMASVVSGLGIVYTNGQPTGMASPFLKTVVTGRIGFFPFIVAVWLVIILVSVVLLERTRVGWKLYGVGANELTARLSGVRVNWVKMAAYAFSGLCSSLAGMLLLGYTGTPYLDVGTIYIMPSVVTVIIGGIAMSGGSGSYIGVVVGAIILTTLDSLLVTLRTGAGGRLVIYGLVILVVLTLYSRSLKELFGFRKDA